MSDKFQNPPMVVSDFQQNCSTETMLSFNEACRSPLEIISAPVVPRQEENFSVATVDRRGLFAMKNNTCERHMKIIHVGRPTEKRTPP